MHRRVAVVVAVVLGGLLVAPACGLGDKARLEKVITSAPARYEGTTTAGTITVASRLTKLPAGAKAQAAGLSTFDGSELPPEGLELGVVQTGFVLDLKSSKAALLKDDAGERTVVFDDLVYYGRRGGVPADDARPWVRLDLGRLDDTAGELDPMDGQALSAIYALPPAVLVDLAAGALTGSIKPRTGADALEGAVARYDVNISLRKALRDTRRSRYPEDRREEVEELFRLLGVVGDLHPGEVWLDAEGRIRRFRIELRQEPQRKVEFRLLFGIDLAPSTAAVAADAFHAPAVDEVLGVDSVLRFTSTVSATGVGDDDPAEPAAPPPLSGTNPAQGDGSRPEATSPSTSVAPTTTAPTSEPAAP